MDLRCALPDGEKSQAPNTLLFQLRFSGRLGYGGSVDETREKPFGYCLKASSGFSASLLLTARNKRNTRSSVTTARASSLGENFTRRTLSVSRNLATSRCTSQPLDSNAVFQSLTTLSSPPLARVAPS